MLWWLCFSKQIFYFTVTKKIWVISCNPSQKHDHNIASTLWRFESPPLDLTILTAKGYSNKLIFWGRTVHCTVYSTLNSTVNFKLWECCVQKYVLGPQMLYFSTVLYIEVQYSRNSNATKDYFLCIPYYYILLLLQCAYFLLSSTNSSRHYKIVS